MKKVLQILCLMLAVPITVNAASFGNGDFSAGGNLWNDASGSGSVSFGGGQAVLETGAGADPFSAVIVQGDDGLFNFASPISLANDVNWLIFDVSFENLGADSSENGTAFFTDALFVALYDALDFTKDLILDPFIDSSVTAGFNQYALNVSALQGRDVALSFELSDEDDGFNSRVTLDNIQFASTLAAPVPEPSSILLICIGLPFFRKLFR